ncbi:MAG: metallophosphoesterase [Candidatus Thermoplasmatota archaeon]|nr:metallophosphoesterase [Candidatus Thermoplasmatota archaeon]
MKNSKRSKIALMIGSIAVACLLLASITVLLRIDDEGVDITGGTLLSENSNRVIVRCLSPDVTLSLRGFSGEVIFTNCVPDAQVLGFDGAISREGMNISFVVDGGDGQYQLNSPHKTDFCFAVLGDSQGFNNILSEALRNLEDCEFVIHCGDMTPSGMPEEFDSLQSAFDESPAPVYTTPGNHDVKNNGSVEYQNRYAPLSYSFEYSGITFAIVDSSDLNISEEEIAWMEDVFEDADRKVIVTHAPCYDPYTDNHTLDPSSCERFHEFVLSRGIDAVFAGHVHAFDYLRIENSDFIITGGAGASLDNGTHHFVIVTVSTSGFAYEKVDIFGINQTGEGITLVAKNGIQSNLTYDDLKAMTPVHLYSSYENLFGNIGGQGFYTGVRISDLISMIGGMDDGDILRITSTDGFFQDFGYLNVYPNETWFDLQGFMTLSFEYEGTEIPDWQDGPRLSMLPSDGFYSNSDCEITSYEGQGYDIYPSAGSRWVRNVSAVSILDGV